MAGIGATAPPGTIEETPAVLASEDTGMIPTTRSGCVFVEARNANTLGRLSSRQ